MPPGRENPTNVTPMLVPATPVPLAAPTMTTAPTTTYGTQTVVIDGDMSPLIPVAGMPDNNDGAINVQPVCRDLPFAVLFLVHAVVMVWLGYFIAPEGYDDIQVNFTAVEDQIRQADDTTEEDIKHFEEFAQAAVAYVQIYPFRVVQFLVLPCCIVAYIVGGITTTFVIRPCPSVFVYSCLISCIVATGIWLILSALATSSPIGIVFAGLLLAASIYYVSIAWKIAPFAAVNLKISLEGIGRNSGIYLVAFLFATLGFVWVIYWLYVVVGTLATLNHRCQVRHPEGNFDMTSPDYDDQLCQPSGWVIVGFLLSLYWTNTIIMNTVQVTVAGVMATWCFDKADAQGCCSGAILGSVFRSLTYSFGSICFGSLLQALVSVVRYLLETARNQRNRENGNACGAVLLCILECLARLFEDILEYFNQWAYVFCGIYGYSYLESGKAVMELFRNRGFTTLITDNLVGYVLGFTTFLVAVLTGIAGIVLERIVTQRYAKDVNTGESYLFGPLPAGGFAFGVSFIVGLWIVSVMMNVVKGAVNTLIVCWADNPTLLSSQHPLLTQELINAWSGVFSMRPVGTPAIIV